MKTYFYIFLIVGLFFPHLIRAQIKLDVRSSKKTIEVGEAVEVRFIIKGHQRFELGQINFPNIENAQLLGSREQTNFSYSGGESVFTKIISFVLRAEKEGKIIIPPVSVEINDQQYSSKSLSIQVNQAKENNFINKNKRIFLDVELSETSVYYQQPIIATFKLYSLSYDALRRRSDLKNPTLNDFQVKKISNNNQRNFKQEVVGDRVYVSEEVAKYELIPQKSGELTLPPFGITLQLMMGFNNPKLININTNKIKVKVNPLPANAPKSFTGAVGDFKINTYVDKKYLKSNESLQLEVELIGAGNFSTLDMPALQLDEDLEVYNPMRRDKFQNTAKGEKGKIVNTYAIVPQYGGNYAIPAIEFTYFNPSSKTYETIKSKPIAIEVEGKPKPKQTTQAIKPTDSIQELNDKNGDSLNLNSEDQADEDTKSILNIKLPKIKKTSVKNINNKIENNWVYWLVPGAFILLLLVFFLTKKKRKNKSDKQENLKNKLKELNLSVKNNEVENSVHKAEQILNDLQIKLKEEAKPMKPEIQLVYEKVMKEIQLYRYASESPTFSLNDLYKKINYIITESLK